MKWLFIFCVLVLPQVTFGQVSGGLVQCRGNVCDFCDFITTVNTIVNWSFSILAIVAVGIFVYAGFLLVTSGGDTGAVSKANSMFTSVTIGFVIVLSAWLIVDTLIKALIPANSEFGQEFGMWNEYRGDCGTNNIGTEESSGISGSGVVQCENPRTNSDGTITCTGGGF